MARIEIQDLHRGAAVQAEVAFREAPPGTSAKGKKRVAERMKGRQDVRGLTSIVILNLNGGEHIRPCIESIRACTQDSYELIVVDNGSLDGSLEYLRSLPDISLIENSENRGVPARNQGLALARGKYIVSLDNDVVATEGWLERFIACAEADPLFGVLGPRSNYVSGPQVAAGPCYSSYDELQAFANEWAERNVGRASCVGRLVGFCLFMKREVVEKIGGFDPAFRMYGWEDDDFGVRAQIAGYRLVIVHEAYIHHTGSQTSGAAGIDYGALLLANWHVFRKKWRVRWRQGEPMSYPLSRLIDQRFSRARHAVPIPRRTEVEKLLHSPDATDAEAECKT